ncbi:MAG: MotA/TolQ/ExbB proton channel family protein [Gammaproteobacteria bacterium]
MKRISYICLLSLLIGVPGLNAGAADKGLTLDSLLKQVQQGKLNESKENKAREQEFKRTKARQSQMLADAKKQRAALEAKSALMEKQFDANETEIAAQTELLAKRLGSLKELFGVLQQVAGDARAQFDVSLTDIQYPDRGKFLTLLAEKMSSTTELPSLEEIERLWFELQREMTESGKIARFPAKVVVPGGDEVEKQVIRVGLFNLISDGKYLKYDSNTKKISELLRQPKERFVKTAQNLTAAKSGIVTVGVDPTRGQLLGLLVNEPSWYERATTQGGTIGWIIIYLGGFALFIAIIRTLWLSVVSMLVANQKRNLDKPGKGNPLGRVLMVYHNNQDIDLESLELRMGEAVMKELPGLNRFNTLLKVIAVVAPLLGLLGTVTGMIITFQSITLFGTGDPKLMAGGISQALVTTMLGLIVAIPTVFMHSLVSGRSRQIVELLEEQATGMVAKTSEGRNKKAPAA